MSDREKHSASVALLLENHLPSNLGCLVGGIILVQKRETGRLGLIAGHLEKENLFEGLYREFREETGLGPADVKLEPGLEVIIIPSETKTSIGLLVNGKTTRPIPAAGYEPESEEISLVRPYSVEEVLQLIANPELLYKPEFNLAFLSMAILDYIGTKYAFDDARFQEEIARSWGVEERFIQQYL